MHRESNSNQKNHECLQMANKLNVGIVGCGNIARFHLNELRRIEGAEVVGLADLNSDNLKSISADYNISDIYSSLDELLYNKKPDIIHILTPPLTHRDLSIKAMKAGCHVLVEKPMAMSLKDANNMIEASEKNNVKLSIDHNLAFEPVVRKAQGIVNSFEFGDLVHLDAFFIFDTNRLEHLDPNDEKFSKHWIHNLKGGLLQDLSPHPLSLALSFMRDIKNVYSIKKKIDSKCKYGNDELRVLIDSNSATTNISMSLRAKPDNIILNLYGTKMTIRVDISNMILVKQKLYNIPKKVSRGVDNLLQSFQISNQTISNVVKFAAGRVKDAGGLGYLIQEFYKSIKLDTLPPVTGLEGAQVIDLMNKIWE